MKNSLEKANKTKIARRFIEIISFLDAVQEATIGDVVRELKLPQSSTSDLLYGMIDLGLLYRDPLSRSFSLTASAALLGQRGQLDHVRDGEMVRLLDNVARESGLVAILLGRVSLDVQIIGWAGQPVNDGWSDIFRPGMKRSLTSSAAGQLLLSSVSSSRRAAIVRHLHADADENHKFSVAQMLERLDRCNSSGRVIGRFGFNSSARIAAQLLPGLSPEQALSIGLVVDRSTRWPLDRLFDLLNEKIGSYCASVEGERIRVDGIQTAA
ncbi:MAG TPA: helix-turn-helix domain-containing protein [Sphingobium sp.]|uniref:helix-turn-helix domain-containing protein n=1 Tax=Sphingobium sp. TaxID=1912891 RepID=UPI002ED41256